MPTSAQGLMLPENLGHVVADEPKKHVDQVRAQVEQRAAASLRRAEPAIVQRLTGEHARERRYLAHHPAASRSRTWRASQNRRE